jgi:plastocyanin
MRIGPRMKLCALAVAAAALGIAGALAAERYRVPQQGRQFRVAEITINKGDVIEFTNEDEFLHQIYVDSPEFKFDSDEQAPGKTISLVFPVRGTFEVHCHIHPKMLLRVTVK